jgi:hypothetical protein
LLIEICVDIDMMGLSGIGVDSVVKMLKVCLHTNNFDHCFCFCVTIVQLLEFEEFKVVECSIFDRNDKTSCWSAKNHRTSTIG